MNAISANPVKAAVQQNPILSRRGLLEHLFSLWFNGFVYNQIWEDPRVDLAALELAPDSRLLTISSGGCNVLNYLTVTPASITAVDLNPYHMHLTRLKLAALAHLPDYHAFFQFFGQADQAANLEHYRAHIRPHLDENSQRFWETRTLGGLGKPRMRYFAENFYRHARSGYFLRFLHGVGKLAGSRVERLFEARSLEEQNAVFETEIAPFFRHWLVKAVGSLPFAVFSLGIPPQQYAAMRAESGGNLLRLYQSRVKRLACDFPIEDNYFAWQGFGLRYDCEQRQAIPDYLKPGHYDALKANLHRVDTRVGSLIDYLREQPARSLDRFVLLDAQDWMNAATLTALWREIARVGKPGSRIVFRTASCESPLEIGLPPLLRARLHYDYQRSLALHAQDRSAIYGGFHLYLLEC